MTPLRPIALASVLCLAPACGGDNSDDTTTASTTGPGTAGTTGPDVPTTAGPDTPTTAGDTTAPGETTSGTSTTGSPDGALCVRLGGMDGVGQLVGKFLELVLADDRINAYFLRSDLDWAALGGCITHQLGQEAECADALYTCKDMKMAHLDMRISVLDFSDFAEDFGKAWDAHKALVAPDLTDDDKTGMIMFLAGAAPLIIEDTSNNETVYQRVGRKPKIEALIDMFLVNVAADPTIVGFFDTSQPALARLKTCLVRQIHGLDGVAQLQTYGLERDDFPPGIDPGPTMSAPCRDMVTAHATLVDTVDMKGIETVDFTALVTALVNAMTTAGVAMPDQDIILAALKPLCPMIVTVDPLSCPV